MSDQERYWWKMPDDEPGLMALKGAEIRCYMVVSRAIQQDRNKGRISVRQVATRARVSPRHAHAALGRLIELGFLCRVGRAGATTMFDLPHGWKGSNCIPTGKQLPSNGGANCIPTGKQLPSNGGANCIPTGEQLATDASLEGAQNCVPRGEQNCIPTGKQHLDSLDLLEPSSSSNRQGGRSGDAGATAPATTTTSECDGSETLAWADADASQARRAMQDHFGALMLPDLELTREVLANMRGVGDVHLWLADLTARRVKIKGWGFYLHDARKWPLRRADVHGQQETRRAAMEAEARANADADAAATAEYDALAQTLEREHEATQEFIHAASAAGWKRFHPESRCEHCHGFGRRDLVGGEVCDCISGLALQRALEHCALCDDSGVFDPTGAELVWCSCVHAVRRREREPQLVESFNRAAAHLRTMDGHGARAVRR
jgi:hypothetical protein